MENFDTSIFLSSIQYLDENNKEYYKRLYKRYVQAKTIEDAYDLDDIEKMMYGLTIEDSSQKLIAKILSTFRIKAEMNDRMEDFDRLMEIIDDIVATNYSDTTKIKVIKSYLAEYAAKNDIECYLFESNKELFKKEYYSVIGNSLTYRRRTL